MYHYLETLSDQKPYLRSLFRTPLAVRLRNLHRASVHLTQVVFLLLGLVLSTSSSFTFSSLSQAEVISTSSLEVLCVIDIFGEIILKRYLPTTTSLCPLILFPVKLVSVNHYFLSPNDLYLYFLSHSAL